MSETVSQDMTPEDYRRRYFELKERAQQSGTTRSARFAARNPAVIPPDEVELDETIPGGWYWTGRIARGLTLRLINETGDACVSALFWNARDTSERFNPGDTVKVQWSARLSRGHILLSDMGRVLCSITDDTFGAHDFIAGGSTRASDDKKFGSDPQRRNTRDNFVLAAAKHGLTARDVGPCVSFFAPVATEGAGRLAWQPITGKEGSFIDLRAEMDLIVALSACPHPLNPAPSYRAVPAHVLVWRSADPEPDDVCRMAGDEAVRAFENTDDYLRAEGQIP